MQKLITAKPDSLQNYVSKIWSYRHMILILAQRDLKIKYAQTFVGLAWTLLQPITAVLVFSLFFHFILKINASYPYSLFVLSGYLNWSLFNYIFNHATPGLINQSDLVKKIHFPKIIIPLSKVIIALVEFTISFIFFLLLVMLFNVKLSISTLLLPLAIAPVVLFALGTSLLLSALTVKKRDLLHFVPFVVNFSIWFTPVFYPVNLVPDEYHSLLYINPITSSIHLFRNLFLEEIFNAYFFIGLVLAIIIFIIGVITFKSVEEKINDNL
jgi:lipopolysaccharide transport system permease protein